MQLTKYIFLTTVLIFLVINSTSAKGLIEQKEIDDYVNSLISDKRWSNDLFIMGLKQLLLKKESNYKDVNRLINTLSYQQDEKVWGMKDYWSAPHEFLLKAKGDCEDYAIFKYIILRKLGVKDSDLRLTSAIIKGSGESHMVLMIKENNQWIFLDNQYQQLKPLQQIKREDQLALIYSLNAEKAYVWINGQEKELGDATRASKWPRLINKMRNYGLQASMHKMNEINENNDTITCSTK